LERKLDFDDLEPKHKRRGNGCFDRSQDLMDGRLSISATRI
jgi:hypothetical protein